MIVWVFTYLALMNDPALTGTEDFATESECMTRLRSWVVGTLDWRERSGVLKVGSLCTCHAEMRT